MRLAVLLSVGLLATSVSSAETRPPVTVLAGGSLIDGTGAPLRADVDVVITGDRISAIGATGKLTRPAGATVVDVRGRVVMPGLIDSHTHYQPWMGTLFLYEGVTSAFDLGNELKIFETRAAIRAGRLPGPRLYVAGLGLQGAPPAEAASTLANPRRTTLKTLAETRAAAIDMLDRGADVVKVREWIPADWMREVVAVAHARNKPVIGHLTVSTKDAIEAGLDGIAHAYGIDLSTLSDPETLERIHKAAALTADRSAFYPFELLDPDKYGPLIELAVSRKVFFNPAFGSQFRGVLPDGAEYERYDAAFLHGRSELGFLAGPIEQRLLPYFTRTNLDYVGKPPRVVDAEQRKNLEIGMERVAEFMRRFVKAGGKMVAGTDSSGGTGGIAGIRLHRELQLWVDEGVPPMEALRGATQYAAELLRLPDIGTLEVGKQADLLVLEGNPLEDMRLLGAIDAVYLGGKPVQRTLDPAQFLPLVHAK